jgi:hypothetical protein
MLWTNVCLDEWPVSHLNEEQFKSIMKHARGFVCFSVAYIDIGGKPKERTDDPNSQPSIFNCLSFSYTLEYADLSGQLVSDLNFLRSTPRLEYLFLNDCLELHDISEVCFCNSLTYLSLNRVIVSENKLVQSVLSLSKPVFLGIKGNKGSS